MTEASAPTHDARDYELVHRTSGTGMVVLRYRDSGVRLDDTGLAWTADGAPHRAAYASIAEIRLQTGTLGRGGAYGTCTITFRNGGTLGIFAVTRLGNPDREKGEIYRAFVQDLHARLGPEDRTRIRFVAGSTAGFRNFGKVAMALGVAFFVVMPIVLLMITGDLRTLGVLAGGAIFIAPFLRTFRRNAPATYRPEHIPEELMP